MLCKITEKRQVSALIPYQKRDGVLHFYLQKREKDSKFMPDMFGIFGGGIEAGETMEQGLVREIQEELNITPEGYEFFATYGLPHVVMNIFALEVADGFENTVKVDEGEYGKFFSEADAIALPNMAFSTKMALYDLAQHLKGIVK